LINRWVNLGLARGNREVGGGEQNREIGEFSFRGILQRTTDGLVLTDLHSTCCHPISLSTIGRLSGVGALWDCVSRVCGGGGGCAGGGVPLGAVPVLS